MPVEPDAPSCYTGNVLPYFLATLRAAGRSPAVAVAALLGVLAGAAGVGLSILALGDSSGRERELLRETACTLSAICGLWWITRALEQSALGGFATAADLTRPGPAGRLLGQWLGASSVGVLASLPLVLLAPQLSAGSSLDSLYLLCTITWPTLHLTAWGLLLASRRQGALPLVGGIVIWALAHLPWSSGGAGMSGAAGRVLASLLPTVSRGPWPEPASLAACAGILLFALAAARPAEARG